MNKRNGFTLIELLAVIVILAVIALIATPIIMGVMNDAKKGAFQDSAYGILEASKLYFADKLTETKEPSYIEIDFGGDMKDFVFKGEKPAGGTLLIDNEGKQALAIYDKSKKWCAVKTFVEDKIRMIENYKKCDKDIAENLVINGYGEYGDNTNFSAMTFQDNVFSVTKETAIIYSDEKIAVDSNKKYYYSMEVKSTNSSVDNYLGLAYFDIDEKEILALNVISVTESLTTLKQDLKNGDTEIYVDNLSGFTTGGQAVNDGVIFWNYKDSTGYEYPPQTYSANVRRGLFLPSGIDKSNHVIHLREAWEYGNYKKGTPLSQTSYGGSRQYNLYQKGPFSQTFEKHEVTLNTVAGDPYTHIWAGTKSTKIYILANYNGDGSVSVPGTTTSIRNIVLKEVHS